MPCGGKLAHGLSRQEFLLTLEEYSTVQWIPKRRFAKPQGERLKTMERLEGEGQAGADAALILREDQQRAVAQEVRADSPRQADSSRSSSASKPLDPRGAYESAGEAEGSGRARPHRQRTAPRGHGVVGLPAVAGAPAGSGAIQRAGERDRIGLRAARMRRASSCASAMHGPAAKRGITSALPLA